jgi:putative DNA primase/helicase
MSAVAASSTTRVATNDNSLVVDVRGDASTRLSGAAAPPSEAAGETTGSVAPGSGSSEALFEPGNEACCRKLLDQAVATDARTFVAGNANGPLAVLRLPRETELPNGTSWNTDLPATSLATAADVLERAETICWVKPARKGGVTRIHPPRAFCADYLMQLRGRYAAPVLCGISRTPLIETDGSISFPSGYDVATRLYFDRLVPFALPDQVSHDEAKTAANLLLEPFSEYKLTDQTAGDAVLLALMFTAIRRPLLVSAPLFVIRSSMPGAGKGLIVACTTQLALGTRPVIVTYGGNAEEFEKRLASVMLQTPAALSIDNANGMLIQGDLLESLITEGCADIRPLGRSETLKIQNRALMCLTGNNPIVAGDMARRTLVVDVVPRSADPEREKFAFNPVELVTERRIELLVAAYTAMRGYRQAGMPDPALPGVGSFEAWSRDVRDLVHWLTGYDVAECFRRNKSEDPHRQNDGSLLAALHAHFGTSPFRSAEAVSVHRAVVDHQRAAYMHKEPTATERAVYDAVEEVLGSKGVSAKNLGYWARRIANAHIGGYVLETQHDTATNTKTMTVTR